MAATAVLQTLERAWTAIEPLSLPMALAGGLALSVWRHPRATLRANREMLDRQYLEQRAISLGVAADLQRVWNEAE